MDDISKKRIEEQAEAAAIYYNYLRKIVYSAEDAARMTAAWILRNR